MKHVFIYLLTALGGAGGLALAQDDATLAQVKANEQRLRETLRATMQQLRAAEAEKATLLAQQAEDAQKIADLEARVARLTQDLNDEKAAADKSCAEWQLVAQKNQQEIERLNAALAKWKAGYEQAVALVKKTEAEREKLNLANIELERKVEERERQNLALYRTGAEILQRYTDFSLGRALVAREPFTGLAKARLEEQIQDYADKLEDSKIKPAAGEETILSSSTINEPTTKPAAKKARSTSNKNIPK